MLPPREVLGVDVTRDESLADGVTATAHFRADQITSPELAKALAELILAAQRMLAKATS